MIGKMDERILHRQVARYFDKLTAGTAEITQRDARELAYQWHEANEPAELAEVLGSIPHFMALHEGEAQYEVMVYWKQLADAGYDVEERYRRSLDVRRWQGAGEWAGELAAVAGLLQSMSCWSLAEELYGELLSYSREQGERTWQMKAHGEVGWMLRLRGEYVGAMEHFEQSLAISGELGDRRGISIAIGNMGNVHTDQGRYAEATECCVRQLAISKELGDRNGIARAVGNMGNIHWCQGRYAEALECFGSQLAICEELGDRSGMSRAITNMGAAYSEQGRYADAMECYSRKIAISEELGDRRGISIAIGNMGNVHVSQGRYEEALECCVRKIAICEELGDRNGMFIAIGNMGNVHRVQGRYAEALRCYGEALDGHRAIGLLYGVTDWLAGTSGVLVELAEGEQESRRDGIGMPEYLAEYLPGATAETWRAMSLRKAREDAEKCVAISEELSKPDTLFSGRVALARIDAAEGHTDHALERLRHMLEDATDDEQRAELHYQLWRLSPRSASGEGSGVRSRAEALRLYTELLAKTPKHEYRNHIEELQEDRVA
jgi:tetratricopeptide (TPR) repeat protein